MNTDRSAIFVANVKAEAPGDAKQALAEHILERIAKAVDASSILKNTQEIVTRMNIAKPENIFRYHSGTGLPIPEPVQKMYKYMQRADTGIDRN